MKEKTCCKLAVIYRFISPSGKSYVGQTRDLKRRRWNHSRSKESDKLPFARAVYKYGIDAFQLEVLQIFPEGVEQALLDEAETKWISHFDATVTGYNVSKFGTGNRPTIDQIEKAANCHRGKKRSPETCKRISEALRGKKYNQGRFVSEETKMKISNANKGRKVSDETKGKIKQKLLGKKRSPVSEETRQKLRIANLGKTHSEDTKTKISKMKKSKDLQLTDEHKEKIAASLVGREFTEDHKKNISQAATSRRKQARTGMKNSEEHRRKISESLSGKTYPPQSEETKKKRAESMKQLWIRRRKEVKNHESDVINHE